MRRKSIDFYIGLFVLVALLTIAFMILKFGGMHGKKYEVTVLFDDAGGVIKEAPVTYAGVPCGTVKGVIHWGAPATLKPGIPSEKVKDGLIQAVQVVLSIDEHATLRIGDKVRITAVSLLGEMAVQIVPARGKTPPLSKDGRAVIVGTESAGPLGLLSDVVGPVPEVMENLRVLTSQEGLLTQAIEGWNRAVNESLPAAADDIRAAVRTLSTEAQALLSENREQVGDLIKSVDQTVKSSSDLLDNLKRMTAEGGVLTETVEDVREAVGDFRRVARTIHPVVESLRTAQGGLGRLIMDPTWYQNMNKLIEAMREYGPQWKKAYAEEEKLRARSPRESMVWVR